MSWEYAILTWRFTNYYTKRYDQNEGMTRWSYDIFNTTFLRWLKCINPVTTYCFNITLPKSRYRIEELIAVTYLNWFENPLLHIRYSILHLDRLLRTKLSRRVKMRKGIKQNTKVRDIWRHQATKNAKSEEIGKRAFYVS